MTRDHGMRFPRNMMLGLLMAATHAASADDTLYRYEGDVLPTDPSAGWIIADPCEPPYAESVENGGWHGSRLRDHACRRHENRQGFRHAQQRDVPAGTCSATKTPPSFSMATQAWTMPHARTGDDRDE